MHNRENASFRSESISTPKVCRWLLNVLRILEREGNLLPDPFLSLYIYKGSIMRGNARGFGMK